MTALDPRRRTRVVVQARLGSTRLPGKAMLTVAGRPLIELVARRAARSGHELVVATSEEDYDEVIAVTLAAAGIPVRTGSLDDVLGRFAAVCADLDEEDLVVRTTGDNPLVDSDLIDGLITATAGSGRRYGRVDIEATPEGLGAEVFTAGDLRAAAAAAHSPYDREHVTPWLRRHLAEHLYVPPGAPSDIHAFRATVDTLNDYVRVSRLFRRAADPVSAPWKDLMLGLGEAPAFGRLRIPRKDSGLGGPATVALDADALDGGSSDPVQRAARARQRRVLLTAAVDHGVTDIVLDSRRPQAAAAVRRAAFPALAERLSFVIRVGEGADESAAVERVFAELGSRHARALLAASPDAAGPAWTSLRRYLEDGVVSRIGCTVTRPGELADALTLDGLSAIEVALGSVSRLEGIEDRLAEAARRGVTIYVRPPQEDDFVTGVALVARPWVSAVIAAVSTAADLERLLLAHQGGAHAPADGP